MCVGDIAGTILVRPTNHPPLSKKPSTRMKMKENPTHRKFSIYLCQSVRSPSTTSVVVLYSYVADAGTGAIIVYDVAQSKALRVVLPSSIASANDVLYMTLANKKNEGYLYFTFLSSPRLYSIKTDLLRAGKGAGSIIDVGLKPYGKELVLLGGDNGSSLFFRYKGENDIYTWNTETCFKAANLKEAQKGGECRLSTQVSFYTN